MPVVLRERGGGRGGKEEFILFVLDVGPGIKVWWQEFNLPSYLPNPIIRVFKY